MCSTEHTVANMRLSERPKAISRVFAVESYDIYKNHENCLEYTFRGGIDYNINFETGTVDFQVRTNKRNILSALNIHGRKDFYTILVEYKRDITSDIDEEPIDE